MERPETRTESLPDSVSEPITSIDALSGGRAKHTAVHNFLTPEDFINLPLEGGFRASEIPQEHDTSVITLVRGHFRSVALLRSRVPNSKLFASALRRAIVRGRLRDSRAKSAERRDGADLPICTEEWGALQIGLTWAPIRSILIVDKAMVLPAERRKRVLIVMFIPSVTRDGITAIDQDYWVGEALELFGRVFGGATAYPKARGVWRDDERGGALVKDEPVVFHHQL
jgi:hypothetical protein